MRSEGGRFLDRGILLDMIGSGWNCDLALLLGFGLDWIAQRMGRYVSIWIGSMEMNV